MKKILGTVFVIALAAAPAMAQKVAIDYAHDFDFEAVKTYQYVSTHDGDQTNQLMHDRIVSMLKQKLNGGGLTEVTENPDIYVTYHLTTQQEQVYNTTNFGYGGYWGGWRGWGGMGTSTTTTSTYTEGTLIFDAYEPGDKKMIWRGTGTVTVKAKPEKQTQQVQNVLDKLGKKWHKILAGQGK